MAQVLGSLSAPGRLGWRYCPGLAWPSPGCCGYLGKWTSREKTLSPSLCVILAFKERWLEGKGGGGGVRGMWETDGEASPYNLGINLIFCWLGTLFNEGYSSLNSSCISLRIVSITQLRSHPQSADISPGADLYNAAATSQIWLLKSRVLKMHYPQLICSTVTHVPHSYSSEH